MFSFLPCIGAAAHPCNTDDTLELVAEVILDSPKLAPNQRRDDAATPPHAGSVGIMYLQPESVIIHVDDPQGRIMKDGSIIWSTENLMNLRDSQARLAASWRVQQGVTVTAPGGGDAPGRWEMLGAAGEMPSFINAPDRSKVTTIEWTLSTYGNSPDDWVADFVIHFGALGTYKVLFEITGNFSGTSYTDSGTYTFHVGPMAELEVRQGARPQGRQKGYVIEAVNNGPSAAAGVLVTLTGVPEGARTEASRGRYENGVCDANGLCEGFWTIDEMNVLERAREIGESEKETLTIFGDGDPITATIKSTEDYSVVVDGTRHSTEYYDHIEDNNEAQITSQSGTGRADPDAPQELKVQKFGDLALLRWEAPENKLVNGWPVTHYQVERNGVLLPDEVPGTIHADVRGGAVNQAYRVRAVNYLGGHTPWSLPAGASGPLEQPGELGTPTGLTATAGVGVGRIDLSWFAPSADASLSYRIEHAADGAGPWRILARNHGGTTYSHTGLLLGVTYYYRVAALRGSLISPWAYVQATTEGVEVYAPGWPMNLRFTSIDRTAVTLAWDPPADDGGSRVTGYEYRVFGPCASGADAVCDLVRPTRVGGTSARIGGLNREGTYQFSVRALNAAGAGDWSNPITKDVSPATAGGGRMILSTSRLTVREGSEATYRVRLSTNPSLPLWVTLHWDGTGDENLGGELGSQQFKILLPTGYDTADLPEWCGGVRLDWNEAYAWNVGVPITVVAAEDDDSEHETLTIQHDLTTVSHDCLNMAEADWSPDPVYDGMHGLALTVTELDND